MWGGVDGYARGMADEESTSPAVSMFENGPIQVAGPLPLSRRRIVQTEKGEPIAYHTYERLETDDTYFLCRCGASDNKPYCDGSHNKVGFESDETAAGTYEERSSSIGGSVITVNDDRSLCCHAGFCGTVATNVWKMAPKADEDTNVQREIVAMVERCPSGALTYTLPGTDELNEPDLPAEVAIIEDGPLYVTGNVPVAGSSGDIETRNRVVLCRCGASATKPLCDGSHKEAGFQDG